MENEMMNNLVLLYKPVVTYYGEWELGNDLSKIAIINSKGKNLYDEFINRYYYTPLNVILKDEELTKSFKCGITSRLKNGIRSLFFSKRAFLRSVIANVDDIIDQDGEEAYKEIKRAIREKKDVYRDVFNIGEESAYYEDVKDEYVNSELDLTFEEFVLLCKKKYTKLLSGYNAVLDLLNKSINIEKFIECFDINKLYLYSVYGILQDNIKYKELYGKLDYNIREVESYIELVNKVRERDNFYNSYISLNREVEDEIYTVDDLVKDFNKLNKE